MESPLAPSEAPPPASAPSPGAAAPPVAAERVPLAIKLAYGMPNFAGAGMAIPIAIHMNI